MKLNLEEVEIIHNPAVFRFEAWVDEYLARLDYRLSKDNIIFTHTEVPPVLQGQGLAGKITQTALEYARENSLKVVPQCSYVATYINKHPAYQDLL